MQVWNCLCFLDFNCRRANLLELRCLPLVMSDEDKDALVQFIASEMQKEGLDLNNEENFDGYLNTKFM